VLARNRRYTQVPLGRLSKKKQGARRYFEVGKERSTDCAAARDVSAAPARACMQNSGLSHPLRY
jgi:hypothetical protein